MKLVKDKRYNTWIEVVKTDKNFFFGFMYLNGKKIDRSEKKYSKKLHDWEQFNEKKYKVFVERNYLL